MNFENIFFKVERRINLRSPYNEYSVILNLWIDPIGRAFYNEDYPMPSISFIDIIPVNLEEFNWTKAFPFVYPLTYP